MNCSMNLARYAAPVLSMMLVLSATAAQAQNGRLEIHGVIISPGCTLSTQAVAHLSRQSSINGQACGLTSGAANPLSSLNIVHIEQQTLLTSMGTADKQLVTLTYR